jgi:hypothetical protein
MNGDFCEAAVPKLFLAGVADRLHVGGFEVTTLGFAILMPVSFAASLASSFRL